MGRFSDVVAANTVPASVDAQLPLEAGEGDEQACNEPLDLPHGNLPAWLFGREERRRKPDARPVPAVAAPDPEVIRPGRGSWHMVMAERAIVRSRPSVDGYVANFKTRGDFVELFEPPEEMDHIQTDWRACLEANANRPGQEVGWMLLSHPVHGQLLSPMQPLCEAIFRNDPEALGPCLRGVKIKEWSLDSKTHPVRLAITRCALRCVLPLKSARADFDVFLDSGCRFPDAPTMELAWAKALVKGLCGLNFDLAAFEHAMEALPLEKREEAEQIIEETAQRMQEMRKIAEGADDGGGGEEGRWRDEETGTELGLLYFANVDRVPIRCQPNKTAEEISHIVGKDQVVMYEYDPTRLFRRVRGRTSPNGPITEGWIPMHSEFGDLMKLAAPAAPARLQEGPSLRDAEEMGLRNRSLKEFLTQSQYE